MSKSKKEGKPKKNRVNVVKRLKMMTTKDTKDCTIVSLRLSIEIEDPMVCLVNIMIS